MVVVNNSETVTYSFRVNRIRSDLPPQSYKSFEDKYVSEVRRYTDLHDDLAIEYGSSFANAEKLEDLGDLLAEDGGVAKRGEYTDLLDDGVEGN